jgi:hypothetical protein
MSGSIKLNDLRDKLSKIKIKAESIHSGLNREVHELNSLNEKWNDIDTKAKNILSNQTGIIKFNVSGKIFATKIETLMSVKDTLFYKIIMSNRFDLTQTIYFDRPFNYFQILLDYIRYKKFQIKRYKNDEINAIKVEAKYFEINDIIKIIDSKTIVEIINVDSTGVNSINLDDIRDRNMRKGIIVKNFICFELNKEIELEQIDIGGIKDNESRPVSINIFVGEDKNSMKYVGNLPNLFNQQIVIVDLIKTRARYIELRSNESFGISYFNIIK